MATSTKSRKTGKATSSKPKAGKEVIHDEAQEWVVKYPKKETFIAEGDDAITFDDMVTMIGWKEVPEGTKGIVPEIKKQTGLNVILTKNGPKGKNRPIIMQNLLQIKQSVLRRRFKINGENLVIGEYGNILSGQHRGLGFICAVLEWRKNKEKLPALLETWPEEPVLESFIAYGVEETDEVFETLNTGFKSTLADVIFRSGYMDDMKPSHQHGLSKMAEFAVKVLWDRTGTSDNPYGVTKYRTNNEAMDFLGRHSKLMEAIVHIWTKWRKRKDELRNMALSLGRVAAYMYLMGTSGDDGDDYRNEANAAERSEAKIDWKNWHKAETFWTELADDKGNGKLKDVRKAIADLGVATMFKNKAWATPQVDRVTAVLTKAWDLYVRGKPVTMEDITLDTFTNPDGYLEMVGTYEFGGIDSPKSRRKGGKGGASSSTAAGGSDKPGKSDPPAKPDTKQNLRKRINRATSNKPGQVQKDIEESQRREQERLEKMRNGNGNGGSGERITLGSANPGGQTQTTAKAIEMELNKLKAKHPDKVLLYAGEKGRDSRTDYRAWGEDAYTVARIIGGGVSKHADGLARYVVPYQHAEQHVVKLMEAGLKVALVRHPGGKAEVELLDPKNYGFDSPPAGNDDDKPAQEARPRKKLPKPIRKSK